MEDFILALKFFLPAIAIMAFYFYTTISIYNLKQEIRDLRDDLDKTREDINTNKNIKPLIPLLRRIKYRL